MMIEVIVLCTIFGVFILFAYTLGLKNGQRLRNDERIELPKFKEPIKEIIKSTKEHDDLGLTKEEQISWDNINNYNGSSESQKPIN